MTTRNNFSFLVLVALLLAACQEAPVSAPVPQIEGTWQAVSFTADDGTAVDAGVTFKFSAGAFVQVVAGRRYAGTYAVDEAAQTLTLSYYDGTGKPARTEVSHYRFAGPDRLILTSTEGHVLEMERQG